MPGGRLAAMSRTERIDFQATSDPALLAASDRGESHLLTYRQLYELWERQQWATQELDFTRDREDWHERFDAEERFQRMYGLSAFFVGEQRVASELGPMMRAGCATQCCAGASTASPPSPRTSRRWWRP